MTFHWPSVYEADPDTLRDMAELEKILNPLVEKGMAGSSHARSEIAAILLDYTQASFSQEELSEDIGFLLGDYGMHAHNPYRKVHLIDGDKTTPIHKAVHPLTVAAFSRTDHPDLTLYTAIHHDVPEDLVKLGRDIEESLDAIVERRDIPGLRKTLRNLSRLDESYREYVQGLFLEEKDGGYEWNEPAVLEVSVGVKLVDAVLNNIDRGEYRPLRYSDDMVFGHMGLSLGKRMESILKALTVRESVSDFLNMNSHQGYVPREYLHHHLMLCLLNEVIGESLDEVQEGVREEFKGHPFTSWLDALDEAIKEYRNTPDMERQTSPQNNISYYIENGVDPSIYDGTLEEIRKKVDRIERETLYPDITKLKHLLMLYTHVNGLQAVQEQLFSRIHDEDPYLVHVKGFADLPIKFKY